jgi:uncharacterized membrane protein
MLKTISYKAGVSSVPQWLLLSCGFSCLLLTIRMIMSGSLNYIFLPWNLFLAFIPYWLTAYLTKHISVIENRFKLFLSLTIWLLFIPNSFYIITDLIHFTRIRTAPKWFDLLLIFSFAWNGILAGLISLRKVEMILMLKWKKEFPVFVVFAVMWLSAFGIYIGRFLRFNSWDVLGNPFSLASEIIDMVIHPFVNGYAWGMTLCYGIFMTVLYLTIRNTSKIFYDEN